MFSARSMSLVSLELSISSGWDLQQTGFGFVFILDHPT